MQLGEIFYREIVLYITRNVKTDVKISVSSKHIPFIWRCLSSPTAQWRPSWKMAAEAEPWGADPDSPSKIVQYCHRKSDTKFGTFVKKLMFCHVLELSDFHHRTSVSSTAPHVSRQRYSDVTFPHAAPTWSPMTTPRRFSLFSARFSIRHVYKMKLSLSDANWTSINSP